MSEPFSRKQEGQTTWCHPPYSNPSPLPFPTISEHEVQRAIFSSKKSTPEQDSIPTSIKKSWSCLAVPITSLFQLCLEKDWHPSPFHQAAPVALPKPGKRDRSSPRSYRFIAFLSVLDKGLERLMARRMAWGSHHTQNPPPSTSLEIPPLSLSQRPHLLLYPRC